MIDRERMARRRTLSSRIMAVMGTINDLVRRGERVHATSLRSGLSRRGECLADRGNQFLGDLCGRHGLGLPSHKQKIDGRTVVCYLPPPGGVSIADLKAKFIIPPGWDWALYTEFGAARESGHVSADPLSAAQGTACPQAGASVPGRPGDSIEAPASGGASVPGQPGDSIEAPASGGTPPVDGPVPEIDLPKRKPRRKRADEDLDLSDLDDLLVPTEESLRREREYAALMAQLADIP